ncbi:MAG TPA: ABC transporter permease [Terracidiphilus sp.]|nr:ABC transporter permease [Terracidiphilus sp.]
MIIPIVRTAIVSLRRDRAALAMSFILPIAFFSILAVIFGGRHDSTARINIILVDEDRSSASLDLVRGLQREDSLAVFTRPQSKSKGAELPEYTAATAEAAVKAGDATVALIIPHGFGDHPISFGNDSDPAKGGVSIQLLNDSSDTIAPQMVAGLLQKAGMTSMSTVMAQEGIKRFDQYSGGFTPEQRKRINAQIDQWRQHQNDGSASGSGFTGGPIAVKARAVVGQNKRSPMISFYAAAIGVMFLLFTASASAGALLDEAESGTLDRVLSSRVTMTTLLMGKLTYNTLLAFTQLVVMFLWAWAVFKLDFFTHIPGFVVMGLCTAFAVAAFGMLLASICRTRAQLGALSTLLILTMSAVGGSMFPRYLMPEAMQKAGLWTINAWAIDGFTKVFWRDLPVWELWPQVSVLLAVGIVFFVISRRIARRWEFA